MPRTRFFPLLGALFIGGYGFVCPAGAQPARTDDLSDVVLPCGVRAALDAIGDHSTADRGHFILEISRRLHNSPAGPIRADALPALIAHLDRCGDAAGERAADERPARDAATVRGGAATSASETLPLPLSVSMWVDTVFNGRVSARRLAAAILASRNASLLYVGLLSLDEGTRHWIGGRPDLIAEIATRHAAAFTLIAPGLRVTSAGVQVPGGQRAEPIWEALVGRSAKDPVEFIRALLVGDERHLPYMFGMLAQLTPAQAHLVFNLDAPDPDARIASARRLHAIYVNLVQRWRVDFRAFSRPVYDPALLAADLRQDDEGRPVLPGTQRFWEAAFSDSRQVDDDPQQLVGTGVGGGGGGGDSGGRHVERASAGDRKSIVKDDRKPNGKDARKSNGKDDRKPNGKDDRKLNGDDDRKPNGKDDRKSNGKDRVESEPVEFAWLCEKIFEGEPARHRARYHQVLFASRVLRSLNADQAIAAVEAVRAAQRYPALVAALERAGIGDVTVIAAAARRAGLLADIDGANDAVLASAQFQGVLMLLQRATLRESISTSTFAELVTSLAAVDLDGDAYRGGLVRWLDSHLPVRAEASSQALASPASGSSASTPPASRSSAAASRVEAALASASPMTAASPAASPEAAASAAAAAASSPAKASEGISASSLATRADEDFEAQPFEQALIDLASGPSAAAPRARLVGAGETRASVRVVEWEGTRYRVDLAAAEAARLDRLRGERPRPYVSAARALIEVADTLRALASTGAGRRGETASASGRGRKPVSKESTQSTQPRDALAREALIFARVADAVGWTNGRDWNAGEHWLGAAPLESAREVAEALRRAGLRGDRAAAARLVPAIVGLADVLLARGVTHLAYAAALGRPERAEFFAEEAAADHDFGASSNGARNRLGPWEHPVSSTGGGRESRVTGSLLGLDVALAPFSLVRLSSRPPPRRPSLNESDRRALIESVVLVRELGDDDRDRIVDAIRKGRERLAAAATSDQAAAIADEIGMGGARRTLLLWSVTRAPDRIATFLSPSELLLLGSGATRVASASDGSASVTAASVSPASDALTSVGRASTDRVRIGPARGHARLDAWGAPARARMGCQCLQFPDGRQQDLITGRWGSGIFVSTFPDLNLRLAELLAEMGMPAALLGPVLTSAMLEFVNNAASRDPDDRRALVEFVQALTPDRLEQYLALLTTDGPLIPIGRAADTSASTGVPR